VYSTTARLPYGQKVQFSGQNVSTQADNSSALYLVATPIGNLGDISSRALDVLQSVNVVAAEDTRHSRHLLQHFAINTRLIAYHEHNEEQQTPVLLKMLAEGESIALVSDAGTPLVSDPGYRLVSAALERGVRVIPIPGACAAIAALSASGLPTDRFVFEGFLPAKQGARVRHLDSLKDEQRTLVFYESCHRIVLSLKDMVSVFGSERQAVLARELTKTFETIRKYSLGELADWVEQDSNQQKGEIVLLVEGAETSNEGDAVLLAKLLPALVKELPVKQAAKIASQVTGVNKNKLYKQALKLKSNSK
jgi:16S rRNA (cytidine1402-2'-O)-methyltransferase